MGYDIVVLGLFNADTSYRAERQPRIGETLLGRSFTLGPGGKGSNQAVAAGRAGGSVAIVTRLGRDTFGQMAQDLWRGAGVADLAARHDGHTGAAYIFIEEGTGDNAIIVAPGVGADISAQDLDTRASEIRAARVFLTQLEQPLHAARRGLEIAREAGTLTILNPAPATELGSEILELCDVLTPNATEAGDLAGLTVTDPTSAETAARRLLERGPGAVVVTLGGDGALWCDGTQAFHVPAISAGPVVETTGAGDAFNGALAVALAEGQPAHTAVAFANAAAALSVTRAGAAASSPGRTEIDALL